MLAGGGYALEAGKAAPQPEARAEPPRWWSPGEGRMFPRSLDYENEHGELRTLVTDGPLDTKGHAFFEPFGPEGRACVTCHQPADSMSLSVESARDRWRETNGADPLFAAFDGSNCPDLPQQERASHSLLLDHGLIRIERPWPPKDFPGGAQEPDFTIEVVRDPYGCNAPKRFDARKQKGAISVYRRPRPVANLKYLIAVGFPFDPKQGLPLPLDPETGERLSGNLMADGRAITLKAQMAEASATHLQMLEAMSAEDLDEILDFEMRIYAAQQASAAGGDLAAAGALGGPKTLEESTPGLLGGQARPVWGEFQSWEKATPDEELDEKALEFRRSVARGARIFREKTFLISDSAGINSPIGFGNPVRNSCVFCHNMSAMGNDVAPGQVDLGTVNAPYADPAPHLPLFRVTCTGEPHPHLGREILTYDPGFALTTGRCADVGKITLQSMRGLAARPPYFSNGSAADLREIIEFYERRYNIGYTEQEKQDLVNLMSAL